MVAQERGEDGLNEHHLRRLLVSCQYIDGLLAEVESILDAAHAKTVFPRYSLDVAPAERPVIEEYIGRIRRQLLQLAKAHDLASEPIIPARRAIHSILSVLRISAEELNPRYLRGYGQVPEPAAVRLKPLVSELQELLTELDSYVMRSQQQPSRQEPK